MQTNYKIISECRICGGALIPFVNYGNSPLANDLQEQPNSSRGNFPLEVVVCEKCKLFQLSCDVDPNVLFGNHYFYSTPKSLEPHFEELVETVLDKTGLGFGRTVVCIGDNNGKLSGFFKLKGLNVFNIEPSQNVAEDSRNNGIVTIKEFFGSDFAKKFVDMFGKVDLVVSTNVFAHSPTIKDMMLGVEILLKDSGIFVQENAYWGDTVKNCDFPQVYHEHFFFYSLEGLRNAWRAAGLNVFDVELNNVQCGSVRAYIGRFKERQSVADMERVEDRYLTLENYQKFANAPQIMASQLQKIVSEHSNARIGIFGVTAKVVLLLNIAGISDKIAIAYDEAKTKQGFFLPETQIKIYSAQEFIESPPDITIIGAYNFSDSILERFKDVKTKWVVPLPEFKVIDK